MVDGIHRVTLERLDVRLELLLRSSSEWRTDSSSIRASLSVTPDDDQARLTAFERRAEGADADQVDDDTALVAAIRADALGYHLTGSAGTRSIGRPGDGDRPGP